MNDENELALKRLIRDRCSDWPDSVPQSEARRLFEILDPGLQFADFGVLFEEATGYAFGRVCRRNLSYADATLRAVANELLLLSRLVDATETFVPIVGQAGNADFPHLLDVRYGVASLIFSTLNGSNPSLQRSCPPASFERLVGLIVEGIPASRRWIVLPPIRENADLLSRYHRGNFSGFTDDEYRYVNILEDDNIGWITTYGVDEGLQEASAFNAAFNQFVRTLGLPDFTRYRLPLHIDPAYFDDPVTPHGGAVGSRFVRQYASEMGVAPEKLVFTAAGVHSMRLTDLPTSFVPIFAQIQPGEALEESYYMADPALIELNNPARLCYSLPEPRKVVLQGIEKGHVFESYVYRLLTGEERVEVLQDVRNQPFPDGFVRVRESRGARVVRYSYDPPANGRGFRVAIEGFEGSALWDLARSVGKPRTEVDILLVQKEPIQHILVGECKFSEGYRSEYVRRGRLFVERIAAAIQQSDQIRIALGLPTSLPVVPVLFNSHSGKGMSVERPSLMVPMTHLLSGRFRDVVASRLT